MYVKKFFFLVFMLCNMGGFRFFCSVKFYVVNNQMESTLTLISKFCSIKTYVTPIFWPPPPKLFFCRNYPLFGARFSSVVFQIVMSHLRESFKSLGAEEKVIILEVIIYFTNK